jgi:hypothetical protein
MYRFSCNSRMSAKPPEDGVYCYPEFLCNGDTWEVVFGVDSAWAVDPHLLRSPQPVLRVEMDLHVVPRVQYECTRATMDRLMDWRLAALPTIFVVSQNAPESGL